MTSLSWLHFSDLHRGEAEQEEFFKNYEEAFYDDLAILDEKSGPWDFIIFTGDLTYSGVNEHFDKLNDDLEKLYKKIDVLNEKRKTNYRPILFAVPGNHDMERPVLTNPYAKLLKYYDIDQSIRSEFWNPNPDINKGYKEVIDLAFSNYLDWLEKWYKSHPETKPNNFNNGIIPGDFSATFKKDEINVGILGLNTSFLQLSEGNYKGKLALNLSQCDLACDDSADGIRYFEWLNQHDLSLLITHHPADWLSNGADLETYQQITDRDHFIAHFFGHMHKPFSYQEMECGGRPRNFYQSISLFGRKVWGANQEERHYGYSSFQLEIDKENKESKLVHWPRKARKSKPYGIIPNYDDFMLNDEKTKPVIIKLRNSPSERLSRNYTYPEKYSEILNDSNDDKPSEKLMIVKDLLHDYFDKKLQEQPKNNLDIIVVGSTCEDVFVNYTRDSRVIEDPEDQNEQLIAYPLYGKILMEGLKVDVGGGGINAAATFILQQFKTAIISCIGRDNRGLRALNWIFDRNIKFFGQVSEKNETGLSIILEAKNHDHTILVFKGANDNLNWDMLRNNISDIEAKWIYGATMVRDSFSTQEEIFRFLKSNSPGTKVAYNPNPYLCSQGLSYLTTMLKLVDVLILTKQAAKKLISNNELPEIAHHLAEQGPTVIAITDGKNGVTVYDKKSNDCFQVIPAPGLQVIDTTGAGDAFGSGFVSGLIRNINIRESALLGVLNAEDVIHVFGAHEHRTDRDNLDNMLSKEMSNDDKRDKRFKSY